MGYFNEKKVITMGILHHNKLNYNYYKYPPQKYFGDIINYINKARIYELALDESIDLTINYFNEIKNYLKETQSNLFNISYDLTEKYYNDFQLYQSFNNYIEDKNNKLENMYKELNNKYNNIISIFNEVVDRIAWCIPFKKLRSRFRENLG